MKPAIAELAPVPIRRGRERNIIHALHERFRPFGHQGTSIKLKAGYESASAGKTVYYALEVRAEDEQLTFEGGLEWERGERDGTFYLCDLMPDAQARIVQEVRKLHDEVLKVIEPFKV